MKEWRQWAGQTVVCMASGPSMTAEDAEYCRDKARVITVNSTWRLAPWADVHYSSDHDWWAAELPLMRQQCQGEFWSGYPQRIAEDVRQCPFEKKARGVSSTPGRLVWGGNSGYCAMGLAHQFGAARIIMLGYDMQDPEGRGHWHGQHPEAIRKAFNWPMWHERFAEMAQDFKVLGVEVVNCTRLTALRCFKRADLREVLA